MFSMFQSLTVTGCGNFVLIGYSSGHVDKFNIQSGIHRGSYGKPTGQLYINVNFLTDRILAECFTLIGTIII